MSQQERWQLSGSGAESYERFQVPSVFEPLARIFLDHVPLAPGQRVLDVACGTGIVARLAAPILGAEGHVAGVDLNADMVAVAGRQAAPDGAAIEWRQGDAAALPFDDAAFDVVLCQQGLQFLPDKPAALAEMHRVLAPGGRMAHCLWRAIAHSPYTKACVEALTRHLGAASASRIEAPFALGDAEALRGLIAGAGFGAIAFHDADFTRRMLPPEQSIPGQLASTPVGPEFAALDASARAAIVADITEAVAAYRVPDGLAIPQGAYVALATA
jgi:ubiquinone/menaquinone biosynthesis C-methylase UbiE